MMIRWPSGRDFGPTELNPPSAQVRMQPRPKHLQMLLLWIIQLTPPPPPLIRRRHTYPYCLCPSCLFLLRHFVDRNKCTKEKTVNKSNKYKYFEGVMVVQKLVKKRFKLIFINSVISHKL